MAEVLLNISIASFALSAIFLFSAIVCWLKFGIPKIIGDLTGRTAKKSIEKIRANNEKTGVKSFLPSTVNARRGKLTANMKNSDMIKKRTNMPSTEVMHPETGLLNDNKIDDSNSNLNEGTTELLNERNKNKANQIPNIQSESGTTSGQPTGKILHMLDEVILIHTDEVIS